MCMDINLILEQQFIVENCSCVKSNRFHGYFNRLNLEVTPSIIFVTNWTIKAKLLGFQTEQGTLSLSQQSDVPAALLGAKKRRMTVKTNGVL